MGRMQTAAASDGWRHALMVPSSARSGRPGRSRPELLRNAPSRSPGPSAVFFSPDDHDCHCRTLTVLSSTTKRNFKVVGIDVDSDSACTVSSTSPRLTSIPRSSLPAADRCNASRASYRRCTTQQATHSGLLPSSAIAPFYAPLPRG